MTAEQSDAPCKSPGTTSATTLVVRHGDVSASRPPTDTTSLRAPYGPVPSIAIGPKPAGARNIDLIARAVRTCNRKPEAVEAYQRLHRTLGSKPSSETEIRP